MRPRVLLDTAEIPGGGELRLFRRDTEFSIMLGANELMNSRKSGSEEALATLACDRMPKGPHPAVLIGGLGLGFTLRAALGALPGGAQVTVAELVPAVIGWARGPMADVFGGSLDDPRVRIVERDVVELIRSSRAGYDAILLDVDNGPDGLTREENDRLYDSRGLQAVRAALRPGGVLTVWSSAPDRGFTRRLDRAGFAAEEVVVRSHGARHVVWVATNS